MSDNEILWLWFFAGRSKRHASSQGEYHEKQPEEDANGADGHFSSYRFDDKDISPIE